MTNSTRPNFGPSKGKSMLAKCRPKRKNRFKSDRMNKIEQAMKKSGVYIQWSNERGNNDNRRNGVNNAQTYRVNSKVVSKEIPKASKRKEIVSPVEMPRKVGNVGHLCNATVNNGRKSSKALASNSHSPKEHGVGSGASTLRGRRGEGIVTKDRPNHLGKDSKPRDLKDGGHMLFPKQHGVERRGKGIVTQDRPNHLRKDTQQRDRIDGGHMLSRKQHGVDKRGKRIVTQDRPNHLGKDSQPRDGHDGTHILSPKRHGVGSGASTLRESRGKGGGGASTLREKKGKGIVTQDCPNHLGRDSLPSDGKDGGLRLRDKISKNFIVNHVNKTKLGERSLEGCIRQGRAPNSLVGEEDDVGDFKSTKERKGQMEKKRKTNVNVGEDFEHLTSNDSLVKKEYKALKANKGDGQGFGFGKCGISRVIMPTISEAIKGHCSLPIDEPIWSGIFKFDNKVYVSLAGHLSTKSCDEVCVQSISLPPVVEVTKHSRLEVWPGSMGVSGSIDENIGLFLFPPKMRPDEKLDQLVKEFMENDLALRAVMSETEMLIFPSLMLPRQYQIFQGKHYLWGLFRPRKYIVGVAEEQGGHSMSPMEHDMSLENQEGFKDGTEQVEFCHVPEPNMDTEPQDPEGAKMQDTADQNLSPALGGSNASRANEPSIAATTPANHEQMHSNLGIPPGRMFAFVAQPTPRFEEIMQELEREGALIVTMP